jgi:hypothetical protein
MAVRIKLQAPAVPNLPLAPTTYAGQHFDILNNVLRLYLNRLTDALKTLFDASGGRFLQFPFIEVSDSTLQYAAGNNTPTIVQWDTSSLNNGFTLNIDNTATALVSGIYKITYSLQFANDDNAAHNAPVWLRINGSSSAAVVPNSATIFTIPARKSTILPAFVCGYSEFVFLLNAGDTVGLWWGTSLAATSGGATGLYIYAQVAQTTPMAYPSNPSAIGSITFVSTSQ